MSSKKVSGGRVWVSVEDSQKLSFMHRSVYVQGPGYNFRAKLWALSLCSFTFVAFLGISKLVTMFNG